eukprot:gb/GFBE01019186.1/.p1 GENE.gb/GFBE01019186.1/~~gb/GFBE01019186.1/.p1  ORF type:complete len:304 (+),score=72.20 gb/GFBE01019186.1/:1-912(+)
MKLQFRSTFIDAKDDEEELPSESGRKRSMSLPASTRHGEMVSEVNCQASNYVNSLAQRAEQLHVLLRRNGTLAPLLNDPVPEAQPSKRQTELETCSTAVPTSNATEAGATEAMSSKASVVDGHDLAVPSKVGAAELDVLAEEVAIGSMGHPEVCQRPCLYFAAGTCSNGAACRYCHMPHEQRAFHPDKQQRELLKQMPEAQLLKMVSKRMRTRAMEMGFLAEAEEVLALVDTWTAQAPVRAAPPVPQHRLAKLEYNFGRMTFSSLLGLAVRYLKGCSESNQSDVVSEALAKMRARLAVKSLVA